MSIGDTTAPAAEQEGKKGGKKKLLLVGVLVVALLAGGGWWFMIRPASAAEKPHAIQVNLAGGHYLRIGIALQASKGAPTDLDGSKALDATIELFSGQSMSRLAAKSYRDQVKKKLEHTLDTAYDGEVIGVYFTDFVTQ